LLLEPGRRGRPVPSGHDPWCSGRFRKILSQNAILAQSGSQGGFLSNRKSSIAKAMAHGGLLFLCLVLTHCSQTSSGDASSWKIDPLEQQSENPLLALRGDDSVMVVVDYHGATVWDSLNDSLREGIGITSPVASRYRKPILSLRFVYSFSRDEAGFYYDYYRTWPFIRGQTTLQDIDSAFTQNDEIISNWISSSLGAVSDSDMLLLGVDRTRHPLTDSAGNLYGQALAFIQVEKALVNPVDWGCLFHLVKLLPFDAYGTNNKRYHDGYFYLTTDNGIAQISTSGANIHWWFHLPTRGNSVQFRVDTSLAEDIINRQNDSLTLLWESDQRKAFTDIAFYQDSIFALQRNGILWISPNRGTTWDSTFNTGLGSAGGLIKTPGFLGAIYGSRLFRFAIKSRKTIELDNTELSNSNINDVTEFKGRLFVATDGGLYSKALRDLE